MTAASSNAPAAPVGDELIGYGRDHVSTPLARWGSTGPLALALLLLGAAAALLPAHGSFSVGAVVASVLCYAVAANVQFEFGAGVAIPTQLVFVPMWFLVPPQRLPLVVCAGMLLGWVPGLVRRRVSPDKLVLAVVASWHAFGPALVLFVWRPEGPMLGAAPVYVACLAAQFAFDYASAFLCTRPLIDIGPLSFLRSVAPAYAVDAMLAPLALLVAFAAYDQPWALLLVLPVFVLLATFAKERQRRIDNALELSSAYRGTAILLGDVIEADDAYTGSHSRDVVELVLAVSDRLGLEGKERQRAEFAALLHDVGKVKIPGEIINKPGPLDADERALMNTHTIVGQAMLDQVGGLLADVGDVVRSCHERWDGGGYPDGLEGEDIPLVARIVCACDAWSAMTSDRSYRKALPAELAVAEMRSCSGTQFDPQVVDALVAVLDLDLRGSGYASAA